MFKNYSHFKELKSYMSHFLDEKSSWSYWTDEACDRACEIMAEFTDRDWIEMKEKISAQPMVFKRKVTDCLGQANHPAALDILLMLVDTDDMQLFRDVVGALCEYFPDYREKIAAHKEIETKINSIYDECSNVSKYTYSSFLHELHGDTIENPVS